MNKKKKQKQSSVKIVIIGMVLLCLVLGYYYYLSNKSRAKAEETPTTITPVQEILLHNYERSYPPTPKEVVKSFAEMTKCLYNEEYTEEEFLALAKQIQYLYDEELISNKTENQYIEDLRWDVEQLRGMEIVLSSYATSSSTDVEYFSRDGYDWARLYCNFTFRKGTQIEPSEQVFVLREDANGRYKIYGWKLVTEEEE